MIDRLTKAESLQGMFGNKEELQVAARSYRGRVSRPSQSKAQVWRAQIAELTGRARAAGEEGALAGLALRRPPRKGRRSSEEPEARAVVADGRQRSAQEEEEGVEF